VYSLEHHQHLVLLGGFDLVVEGVEQLMMLPKSRALVGFVDAVDLECGEVEWRLHWRKRIVHRPY